MSAFDIRKEIGRDIGKVKRDEKFTWHWQVLDLDFKVAPYVSITFAPDPSFDFPIYSATRKFETLLKLEQNRSKGNLNSLFKVRSLSWKTTFLFNILE